MPLAIDELPLVALLGCFAEGETIVRGAGELRVKESDRIATVVDGLRGLGADIEAAAGRVRRPRHRRPARRADRRPRRPPPRAARRGRRARLARRRRGRRAWRPRRSPTRASSTTSPRWCSVSAMVVAIDGPAGAGKSTVARAVAARLGFTYLDSGAMYRAVALAALERGREPAEVAPEVRIELGDRVLLDGRDVTDAIRTPEVSEAASRAAAEPGVRAAMVAEQRRLLSHGDWVAEGRDIGTVVAPDAEVKVFLTADPAERARRRAAELGVDPATGARRADDPRRARPHPRALAAASRRPGAVELDTTGLSLEQVVERDRRRWRGPTRPLASGSS